jgi:ABC-type antimicrobial peptide transport system permease subunit
MVRAIVREVDPLSAVETATLASRLDASVAQPRFAAWTVGAFALLALILSAVGLYGTLSYSVSQRTREIGVRSALGATRGDIVGLVFRQGLLVVASGVGIGLIVAALGSRAMASLLFGVTSRDPVAFLLAPLLLLLAAVLACLVPAWRGASIKPTEALRCE